MSIDTNKDLPALHEDTIAMSASLQNVMTPDKKTGNIAAADDIYEKLAIENGLTNGADWAKFNTTFFAASTHAAGEVSGRLLAKSKDLGVTVSHFPLLGKDSWSVTYKREKEVSGGIPKEGEPPLPKKTVYGSTLGTLDVYAVGNTGEMSKVKKHLAASAKGLFS